MDKTTLVEQTGFELKFNLFLQPEQFLSLWRLPIGKRLAFKGLRLSVSHIQ